MIVPNRDKEREKLIKKFTAEEWKEAADFHYERAENCVEHSIPKWRVREAIKECLEYQSCWQPSDKENFHIDHKLYLSIIAKWERQLKGLLKELGLEEK